jgi:hypothetical protein
MGVEEKLKMLTMLTSGLFSWSFSIADAMLFGHCSWGLARFRSKQLVISMRLSKRNSSCGLAKIYATIVTFKILRYLPARFVLDVASSLIE